MHLGHSAVLRVVDRYLCSSTGEKRVHTERGLKCPSKAFPSYQLVHSPFGYWMDKLWQEDGLQEVE
jgi:hypothetical protein